jgi:microcystin-dependent protein
MRSRKITLTSNNTELVVSSSIIADSLNIESINVNDDVYAHNNNYTPVGTIITYAGATAPGGWLLCDGSEVSKTTYSRLFSVIGTLYGTSTDSTKFVLPNLEDRIPVGKTSSNSLGNTGGSSSVTLAVNQLPSHTHTGTVDSSGSHVHTGTTDAGGVHSHGVTDPGHTHTQTTVNDDFNNSGVNPPGFSADSAGSRTWSNINAAYTGISINNSSSHTHTITTASSGDHAHTFTTNATGSNSSVDIRNKYIVLNYLIRI